MAHRPGAEFHAQDLKLLDSFSSCVTKSQCAPGLSFPTCRMEMLRLSNLAKHYEACYQSEALIIIETFLKSEQI